MLKIRIFSSLAGSLQLLSAFCVLICGKSSFFEILLLFIQTFFPLYLNERFERFQET